MKYCKQCKITTKSDRENCPLCQSTLSETNKDIYETFPSIEINYKQEYLIVKILLLISAVISIICLSINIMIPTKPLWAIYVIIGIVCMWISLTSALKRQTNVIKAINSQFLIISAFAVVWDIITGWYGWSISYVFPIVCVNGLVSMAVVAKIFKYKITDYLIYLIINIAFGIIPAIFLLFNLVTSKYASLFCVIGSIIAFLVLITFEGKNIREELKRRLHI